MASTARRDDAQTMRTALRLSLMLALVPVALAIAPSASAAGGRYVFDGGTQREHAQVRAALDASTFDWSLVPGTVTIHLRRSGPSASLPGHVFLDAHVLTAGVFAWAVVHDEYAHQVDFLLLDPAARGVLHDRLGARAWCHDDAPGLPHASYGCERFASTLAWAYWQSPHNAYRPESPADESAAMDPPTFRALLARLLGVADAGRALQTAREPRRRVRR
jgi:hypothetical protein